MRLFTALWPPPDGLDHLAARLPRHWPEGVRPTPPHRLHLTLCFHGDDADPDLHGRRLAGLADLPAPRVRLTGNGTFPGVLWVGVAGPGLTELAVAAGADPATFRPHVTLARWRRGVRPPPVPLGDYRGPQWTAGEVLLIASEPGSEGPRYRVLQRAALDENVHKHP